MFHWDSRVQAETGNQYFPNKNSYSSEGSRVAFILDVLYHVSISIPVRPTWGIGHQ